MVTKDVNIADGQLEQLLAVAFAPVAALTELIKNSSDACTNKNDIISINIDTKQKTLKIKDNGSGFSKEDIEGLSTIGISKKMTIGNILSAIGEPYAGSKGLGFLTAFNLCNNVELNTYSATDKCGYHLSWKKGSSKIIYSENEVLTAGTEIILYDISDENIFLLTTSDELIKLYLSSITYYFDNNNLPKIELYKDGVRLVLAPKEKIELLYLKNKKKTQGTGYFVAKGTFKYSNDKLTLSYEDNILKKFNFSDEELDLKDYANLAAFAKKNNVYIPRLYKWHEELLELGPAIDDFEGVYYIWREKKDTSADYPPRGIRIYVNNYGLYNYLDKNNDWVHHGQISQNVKATNYKPQNTFGYVNFNLFNESTSKLKISQERNDFSGNIARKKFMHIMCCFVSGIFSQIDITIKNHTPDDSVYFELKTDVKAIEDGYQLRVSDFIKTNLHQGLYCVTCSDGVIVEENGAIKIAAPGEHHILFSHDGMTFPCRIIVKEKVPDFKLKKSSIKVGEGNSINLRELISLTSLKHIDLHSIEISSSDADIQGDIFTGKNPPGEYTIAYSNDNIVSISKTLDVAIKQTFQSESKQVKRLFPNYQAPSVPVKIQNIISGISDAYMRHPILSMIALRTLIEICLRDFRSRFDALDREDFDETTIGLPARFNMTMNMAFSQECTAPDEIKNKYKSHLSGKAKGKLNELIKELDLNTYVHNPAVNTTSTEVLNNLRVMKTLLNFLIDALAT